jgi:hypothetical protein
MCQVDPVWTPPPTMRIKKELQNKHARGEIMGNTNVYEDCAIITDFRKAIIGWLFANVRTASQF